MDRNTLYNEYVINQKPIKDIIREYGISTGTLYYLLDKHDIQKRSKEGHKPYKDRDWLISEYVEKDKTTKKIAAECNVSISLIASYLNAFDIPRKYNKPAIYKDKDWLYDQKVNQNKSWQEIADGLNVDRKTLEYYAKKFSIKHTVKRERRNKEKVYVDITCYLCGAKSQKTEKYIKRRAKEGKDFFFCSRECANKYHSNQMQGNNNPNFEGKFHGSWDHPSFSPDQRRKRTLKQFEKWKENGYFEELLEKMQVGHKKYFSTPEGLQKRKENGIKAILLQKEAGFKSSLEDGIAKLLDKLGLKYEEQKAMYFWVVDFYLPDYNLVIEANGDYWHANPKEFNNENMTKDQKQRRLRDAKLKAYIQGAKKHNFLVIWENDFHKNVNKVIDDIRKATL